MSRLSDSSDPIELGALRTHFGMMRRPAAPGFISKGFLVEGFDLVAVVAGDDADAGALGERRHDLAGKA
jgi:hypothetical protein